MPISQSLYPRRPFRIYEAGEMLSAFLIWLILIDLFRFHQLRCRPNFYHIALVYSPSDAGSHVNSILLQKIDLLAESYLCLVQFSQKNLTDRHLYHYRYYMKY